MTWNDLIRSAFVGLFQHKLRTLLTLTGVTLGSLLLFTSLAGGLGVVRAVNSRLSIGDRLLQVNVSTGYKSKVVTAAVAREAGFTQEMSDERRIRLAKAAGIGGRQTVPLTIQSVQQLESIEHVSNVWVDLHLSTTMFIDQVDRGLLASIEAIPPTHHGFAGLIVAGRDLDCSSGDEVLVSELYLYRNGVQTDDELESVIGCRTGFGGKNRLLEQIPTAIRLLEQSDASTNSRTADIVAAVVPGLPADSQKLKNRLKQELEATRKSAQQFRIVGVFRRPSLSDLRSNPGYIDASHRHVLMPYSPALVLWKSIGNPTQQIRANVLADEPEHVRQIESDIGEIGYRTNSMARLALQIRSAVMMITAIITAIAAGALLISAIGITNTMIMNVLERRREIAIMKSIGARDRDINRMFLLEGMLIGVLGGLIGLFLGWALSRLCGSFIRRILEDRLNEPFGEAIFSYPLWLVIGTPIVASVVTTIATLLPARRAARVDPVATLRSL